MFATIVVVSLVFGGDGGSGSSNLAWLHRNGGRQRWFATGQKHGVIIFFFELCAQL